MAWTETLRWFRNASSVTQNPRSRAIANGFLELAKEIRRIERRFDVIEDRLAELVEVSRPHDSEEAEQPSSSENIARN